MLNALPTKIMNPVSLSMHLGSKEVEVSHQWVSMSKLLDIKVKTQFCKRRVAGLVSVILAKSVSSLMPSTCQKYDHALFVLLERFGNRKGNACLGPHKAAKA